MTKGNHSGSEVVIPDATKVGELMPYTVKDTGVVLMIRKVSPNLMVELQKAFPPPTPPMQEVDYGDGKKGQEPNEAHPDYLRELREYQQAQEVRMQRLLIGRGVSLQVTPEVRAAVDDLKNFWSEEYNSVLEGSDAFIYVSHIAIGTPEDLQELVDAIMKRSQPTEPAIKEALDTFKS